MYCTTENMVDFIFDDGSTEQPVFQSGTITTSRDSACIEIVVEDDEDVEGDEEFQLEIVDASPGMIVSPSITTVTIREDAGMYLMLM